MAGMARCFYLVLTCGFAVAAGACEAPAMVEGIFAHERFRLESEAPLSKENGSERDMLVVLSQVDGETLSTISLMLPDFVSLPLGAAVAVGTGAATDPRPSLEVAVGALLVETRADGVEVLSSTDATIAVTVGGAFTLEDASEGQITAAFRVDLDDGGYLAGSFTAMPGS